MAAIRDENGAAQGLDDFFTDAAPAEGPPRGWAPPPQPGPTTSRPPQEWFGGPTGTPDAFAAGYSPTPENLDQIVTPRRRPTGTGWRKVLSQMTFGLINPGPSAKQEQADELMRRIKADLLDVYVVGFVNAKGGVGKTTMTVAAGSAIARERGDRVIALDVDTDLGNLSSRFEQRGGPKANIQALSSLQDPTSYPTVRVFTVQNNDRLEMLAAQNDPRSSYILNSQDFEATMKILRLHYNVILLDCGTAITSPLFSTIAKHVDSLVVVASLDPPGLNGAWATLQWLQAHGFSRLLPRTVVALNATFKGRPLVDIDAAETRLRDQIPGINVVRVPFDVHLAEGGDIAFTALKSRTRKALMNLAGAVAAHYPARQPQNHSR
ncbi:AAA family ATPase [Mycobacterium sp. SM1]|nr:AAA family ATPase [Mycobacterium sp. SM1]